MHWIHESLGGTDGILRDQKLPDIDTGEPRQIDLVVTLHHGPVAAKIIGEVRDRGRAAGTPWIEEVASKMKSVGAHGAFVVSKSGFTRPARAKARSLGIQAFSLTEISNGAWAQHFTIREMAVRKLEVQVNIDFLDREQIALTPHPALLPKLAESLALPMPFPGGPSGEDPFSEATRQAMLACVRQCQAQLRGLEEPFLQAVVVAFSSPELLSVTDGSVAEFHALRFQFLFLPKFDALPFVLNRYVNEASGQNVAHVYESRVCFYGEPFLVRVLAETSDGILPAGGTLSLQVEPQTELAGRIFRSAGLTTSEMGDGESVGAAPIAVSLSLTFQFHEDILAREGLLGVRAP